MIFIFINYGFRHFLTSSFPTQRLHHYVTKMVQCGYKVGVVKQNEIKPKVFVRYLDNIYTLGSYFFNYFILFMLIKEQ
jgi:DNA mismatch repair ATPase MutS